MAALSLISLSVAMPRSAMPSFDIVVPAPVCYSSTSACVADVLEQIYHVQAVKACAQREPSGESIVDAWSDYDAFIGKQPAQSCSASQCGTAVAIS